MVKVFSTQWFSKYNRFITRIARLPFIGELIFNFKKFGHYIDRKKIIGIQPNCVVVDAGLRFFAWSALLKTQSENPQETRIQRRIAKKLLKKIETGKIKDKEFLLPARQNHYFVRNEYALRLQKVFYPIWITFHIWDIVTRLIPQLNLGFDTLTVYPDAGSGVGKTTCDAYLGLESKNTSWASLIATANADWVGNSGATGGCASMQASATTNQFSAMARAIFTFDTSALTSSATISETVISLYGQSKADNLSTTPNVNIYLASPASNNVIVVGDFDAIGSTAQCDTAITYSGFSTAGYNAFTFNSTGRGNVSKTGISRFGTRTATHDVGGTAPNWSNSQVSGFYIYFADNATDKPKLVVTYTVVVAPTVTTQACDQVLMYSVRGNGNITATGGANATRRGFCYKAGTSGDPTTADSTAYDDGSYSTGAYTKVITGLKANTAYRVRAYAVNSAGTAYGSTVNVITDQSGRFFLMFQ